MTTSKRGGPELVHPIELLHTLAEISSIRCDRCKHWRLGSETIRRALDLKPDDPTGVCDGDNLDMECSGEGCGGTLTTQPDFFCKGWEPST